MTQIIAEKNESRVNESSQLHKSGGKGSNGTMPERLILTMVDCVSTSVGVAGGGGLNLPS